jgi:FlgD Ig-like domain
VAHIEPVDPTDANYENTLAKDFIMDAPWRVVDAQTTIPVTVIIKDCDVDDVRELHWIRIYDETSPLALWYHDFGDEEIGDSVYEQNFWTIIVKATEGYPFLPNGTPLTPANLGYGAGDVIRLRVQVYYKDDFLNYTETRHLRVRVGDGPFPWPADWYGGDVHYHTMYTNNAYEYGAPLPAVKESARAVGLHWLTATDHSSDLDESGDGTYSYATPQWEYTVFDQSGAHTFYRNVAADGGTWQGLGVDVNQLDGPDFRLYRAVELNLASIDPVSLGKTLHCLIYNENYIHSPNSGAPGERPVSPDLNGALAQIQGTGFAYSSHPVNPLTKDFYGFDLGANGSAWGLLNILQALTYEAFRGLQIFNTRATVESTDEDNPWADFDAGVAADGPYPQELLEGVALWDQVVSGMIATNNPRRVFVAGGSDAHGDFNYASHLSLNDYADDNAIGKVQTVAYVPGDWSATNLPPMAEILAAYRAGHTIITDGPFVEIGIDTDGDGGWYGARDLIVGGAGVLNPATSANLHLRWSSLPEFGAISNVKLIAVHGTGTQVVSSFTPASGYSGSVVIPLGAQSFLGRISFRAEVVTYDGKAGHRAYTNPIEVNFDPASAVSDLPSFGGDLVPRNVPNPFNPSTRIQFSLAGDTSVNLNIYSSAGRLVRRLVAARTMTQGEHTIEWDGRDDRGQALPSGVYLYSIDTDLGRQSGKMGLVR